MAGRGLMSSNNSFFFKVELWCLLGQLKKTLFLVIRGNDAMQLFHGICGGQNHSQVTEIVKSNMHNKVPLQTFLSYSLLLLPETGSQPGWHRGSSAAAVPVPCPSVQPKLTYSHGRTAQNHSKQLNWCVSSLFNVYYCSLCQIFPPEFSSYWRWMQHCLRKQPTNQLIRKNCRKNRFRNTLAFTFSSQETDFLWIINLVADLVFIWERIHANVRSDKSILPFTFSAI